MRPEVWGPHAWIFLHSVTLDYPDNPTIQDKHNMKIFINSLGNVLPCEKCRNNFKHHLKELPITDNVLESKTNLVNWLIDIHNCVNITKMTNKLTHEEAINKILENYAEGFSNQPKVTYGQTANYSNNYQNYIYIIIIIILFILIILGYMFFK